jgi:aspartate/methionine/tyrosine aminotransferase
MAGRALAWLAAARAEAAGAAAGPAIDLASDELDQPAAEHIVQATIDALNRGETHYTDRVGIIPLRQALAARIAAEDGLDCNPLGEVLICGGGREALFVATQMIIEPGDEVIVPTPATTVLAEGVRLAGGVPVEVQTRPEDDFALTAEAIEAALTPRTRVLLFASPAAPTGGVTTGDNLAALAALARDYNLLVIWDETFRTFLADGVRQDNIAALPGMRERTAIVGSFSARYAMTGWRTGYVVAPAPLLRPITMMKQALTICSAAPSQWAAHAALTGPQAEAAELAREVAARRAAAIRALAALGLTARGQGTPYLFVDIRPTGLDGRAFTDRALRLAGVRLRPGDDFGPGGAGFVRLSLALPTPQLLAAIGRLATCVG